MPFPSANSYTQIKWLAFFAELTAKLTHHNVLVVMEGAELLKRLLISRVSIAAVLQQGELLVRLLDSWRGCVTAEHPYTSSQADSASPNAAASAPVSAAVALNDELSFVLAEAIAQCIDLMCSLYTDGDSYYCLLVLARAGPMLEVLVDVLQTAPPQLYGITASLLQQLLSLPLGHSEIEMVMEEDGVEKFVGLNQTTLAQLHKSVSLRRHIRVLVEAVQEHGALLQHTADVLAGLLAVQQGPRCLAAVYLFNLASKRLRKFELRHGQANGVASPSPSVAGGDALYTSSDAHDCTSENSELNVTITGAPQAAASSLSPDLKPKMPQPAASLLDELEEGVGSSTSGEASSKSPQPTSHAAAAAAPTGMPGKWQSPFAAGTANRAEDDAASSSKFNEVAAPQDVSEVVDAEPIRYDCTVPPSLAEESLRHLAASRSHAAFFDALDWLWCLTVADAAVVGAVLTPEVLVQALGRYLTATPRTRRDRVLFTLLLLWLGHLHSISVMRRDTHRRLLDMAVRSLLPMLRTELGKVGGSAPSSATHTATRRAASTTVSLNVSAITSTDINNVSTSDVTSAMALAASTGYGVPSADLNSFSTIATGARLTSMKSTLQPPPADASRLALGRGTAQYAEPPNANEVTLLPYAAARKAQEAALLLRPSIEVILLAFLLNIYSGIDADTRHGWVCDGHVLDVALGAVRRASGIRSALLDTPTTIDGAFSDEIYLDYALRSVRTDATTVAVLGCRLMVAVVGHELRWGPGWRDTHQRSESEPRDSAYDSELDSSASTAAAMRAELVLFAQTAMPLLVHIAVNNPDVTAAQEGGAASPIHYVPANLRCTRYTSLGESSLVALDACLQYYAQSGQLCRRVSGQPAAAAAEGSVSHVAVEDLVRVLPTLTRVSHSSVHPPVRAVPYRCLLYISQRLEDVLVVLRDMPSIANAAVSCVLDYTSTSSQWEVAAAAEWLTVLVDLLTEAEGTTSLVKERPPPVVDTTVVGDASEEADTSRPRRRHFFYSSPAEELQEFFHFDDSPLARKLLISIAAARRRSTGSAYAISALLQLAVHLQTYIDSHQRPRVAHSRRPQRRQLSPHGEVLNSPVDEAVAQPLTPAGLSSIAQWILLLQSATADNTRLTRICVAFQRTRDRQNLRKVEVEGDDGARETPPSAMRKPPTSEARRHSSSKPVLKDAWVRALTASEQIALQYTYTATLFRALDMLLRQDTPTPSLYVKQFSNSLICNAVAAAVTLPSPREVAMLLSMRFHASRVAYEEERLTSSSFCSSPALLFGYQAAIQWACRVGASWLRRAYTRCSDAASSDIIPKAGSTPVPCGGGLPSPCSAVLVEELCTAAVAIMRDTATAGLSQRTRCQAAVLLSAVVEVCPAAHLSLLEARGAALFAASTVLRRIPCVSGLQCRLLRRVWSAVRYASSPEHGWLSANLDALRSTVDSIKESTASVLRGADGHRGGSPRCGRGAQQQSKRRLRSNKPLDAAGMARHLQGFQVLTAVLTSQVACVGSAKNADDVSTHQAAPLPPPQRQALCAIMCDALCVVPLRHCVLNALKSMSETAEGRRCMLTDISSAGDPLGRTLFGRVLALTLHIPCRWAGSSHSNPQASTAGSPTSTPQDRHQRGRQRSSSASPRSLSPSVAASHRSPQANVDLMYVNGVDTEPVVALGFDICTSLLGREHTEELGAPEEVGDKPPSDRAPLPAAVPALTPASSFLATFMKHRGLEYLATSIVESDRQQRRQGRPLTVPLHLLRLLAALSLQCSLVKEIVKSTDLFSVVLEVAGAVFPPHEMAATLALLTLRNVCFVSGMKSTLCQDARVLLTLKAAVLKLSCVNQLVEDTSIVAARPVSGSPQVAPGANTSSSPKHNRRVGAEVALRDDVVDPENEAVVTWAVQMCMYARARRSETVARAASAQQKSTDIEAAAALKMGEMRNGGAPVTPRRRAVFGDMTNTPLRMVSGVPAMSSEWNDSELTQASEMATDAEAVRRQYLAATALTSLCFENQRGKAAVVDVLSAAPSCDMEDVRALARPIG
ncbi:hypothetical protein ABL78_0474 [Leptomonas seymouri]|uniref:Uncharacterized protein n=1 Tax=Leptomonas seymouri TaxID=5684 RepID=A0A0N1PFF3_LEPSE|nr:hypothetical protein ABL78_0474 [Leptomonas seymouri]|eukprot:KPI90398.1 hypothetical protein ABL78_0474 [Leptomonas seymouri]